MLAQKHRPAVAPPSPQKSAAPGSATRQLKAAPLPSIYAADNGPQAKLAGNGMCARCASGAGMCPKCAAKASGGSPSLERPPSAAQQRRLAPSNDPAERQADDVGRRIGADLAGISVGEGKLPDGARAVAEAHLGTSLAGTTLHASSGAQAKTAGMGALAVAEGRDVSFGPGQLAGGSSKGKALIGHELVHVAQQSKSSTVGKQYTMATPSGYELPASDASEAEWTEYLNKQGAAEKKSDSYLKGGKSSKHNIRADLEHKVRLRALALMRGHRARTLRFRDTTLAAAKLELASGHADGSPSKKGLSPALQQIKSVTTAYQKMRADEAAAQYSKAAAMTAGREARSSSVYFFIRPDLNPVIATLASSLAGLPPADQNFVRTQIKRFDQQPKETGHVRTGPLIVAANRIKDRRVKQLKGFRQANNVFESLFPFVAHYHQSQQPPKPSFGSELAGVCTECEAGKQEPKTVSGQNQALLKGVTASIDATLEAIRNGIANISNGGIHPLDLPVPTKQSRAGLSVDMALELDIALKERSDAKSFDQMAALVADVAAIGLAALATVLTGGAAGAVAALAGAARIGAGAASAVGAAATLKEGAAVIGDANATAPFKTLSNQHGDNVLGVDTVSDFEIGMALIGVILEAAGAGAAYAAMRGGSKGLSKVDDAADLMSSTSRKADGLDNAVPGLNATLDKHRLASSTRMASKDLSPDQMANELLGLASAGKVHGKWPHHYAYSDGVFWRQTSEGGWCRQASPQACIVIAADLAKKFGAGNPIGADRLQKAFATFEGEIDAFRTRNKSLVGSAKFDEAKIDSIEQKLQTLKAKAPGDAQAQAGFAEIASEISLLHRTRPVDQREALRMLPERMKDAADGANMKGYATLHAIAHDGLPALDMHHYYYSSYRDAAGEHHWTVGRTQAGKDANVPPKQVTGTKGSWKLEVATHRDLKADWTPEELSAFTEAKGKAEGKFKVVAVKQVATSSQTIADLVPKNVKFRRELRQILERAYTNIRKSDDVMTPKQRAGTAVNQVLNHKVTRVVGTGEVRGAANYTEGATKAAKGPSDPTHHVVPLYLGGDHTLLLQVSPGLHDELHVLYRKLNPPALKEGLGAGFAHVYPDGKVDYFRIIDGMPVRVG